MYCSFKVCLTCNCGGKSIQTPKQNVDYHYFLIHSNVNYLRQSDTFKLLILTVQQLNAHPVIRQRKISVKSSHLKKLQTANISKMGALTIRNSFRLIF